VLLQLTVGFPMRMVSLLSTVVLASLCCGCWPRPGERQQVAADVSAILTNLLVPEPVFLSITQGTSFQRVTNLLGSPTTHEFTLRRGSVQYTLISAMVDLEGEGVTFCLLFSNNTLIKVTNVPQRDLETYPYRSTTATRIIPWEIGDERDEAYIEKILNAPALTREQIRARLDQLRPYARAGEPANIMPAFLLTRFFELTWERTKQAYLTNQGLRRRYDGCRVALGMTVEEVDGLFGKPLRVMSVKSGGSARIYGDLRRLDINPEYRSSPVAVGFDAGGRVTRVYSHGFICEEWLK